MPLADRSRPLFRQPQLHAIKLPRQPTCDGEGGWRTLNRKHRLTELVGHMALALHQQMRERLPGYLLPELVRGIRGKRSNKSVAAIPAALTTAPKTTTPGGLRSVVVTQTT